MWLICYLFFSGFAGNCGSSRSVAPAPDPIEEKQNFTHIKRRHIEETVNAIPLPKIAILHRKAKSIDYSKHAIDPQDCVYFRECVARRYEENEEEINGFLQESAERYRRVVFAPAVHLVNLRRARRMTLPADLPREIIEASVSRSSVSLD
jgi:hypothetical protein